MHAVDDVSLDVWRGETLGLVGESGCGKSTLGRCLVRLYEITGGQDRVRRHRHLHRRDRARLRPIRQRMQMVFQDPYASLNPRRRVADLLAEPLKVHGKRSRAEIKERVAELMRLVELQPDHLNRFPHEFSGGQRQRIGIARAIALEPSLVVADEPVSALDVSIQAQIVNLFADLQERLGLTYVFIAHDSERGAPGFDPHGGDVSGLDRGSGPTEEIFKSPRHPYSEALISAVPSADLDRTNRRERIVLQGDVPSPINPPSGCRFHPRCRYATERCRVERPKLAEIEPGRLVACHHPVGV